MLLAKTRVRLAVGFAILMVGGLSYAQRSPMLSNPPTEQATKSSMAVAPVMASAQNITPATDPVPGAPLASAVPLEIAARNAMSQATVSAQRENGDLLGVDTRALFALQASNQAAGPELPMLGNEVTLAYKRYLDSFNLPIPQKFEKNVKSGSSGS